MALDRLTKIDGGGISTTSDYRVGVITATKFVGPVEGAVTGTASTATLAVNAQGLTGTPDIVVGIITASSANFSGNVTVGGTLTYEDVTNIDSVGLITARNGIHVKTGTATTALVVEGNGRVTGILTVGTSSLILDGPNNVVNVGTALTLGHSQGVQFHTQNLHSAGFEVNQINASGIITATEADINGDIDVDGHTNLDNVSISGVTTAAGSIVQTSGFTQLRSFTNPSSGAGIELGYDSANRGVIQVIDRDNSANRNLYIGGGNVGINQLNATARLDVNGGIKLSGTLDANGDLDVDGHTNLDNVSIAGVTTGTTINATTFVGALTGTASGNTIINNNGDNKVITGGSGVNLYAESGFTFDGTDVQVPDKILLNTNGSYVKENQLQFKSSGNAYIDHGTTSQNIIFRMSNSSSLDTNVLTISPTGLSFHDLNITNVGTIALDSIKGDADDNTNITFAGSDVITFKAGTTSPALTINTTQVKVEDDQELTIGTGNDLKIYHTTSGTSWIRHTNSSEYFILEGNQMDFRDYATGVYRARMGTAVQLYYNGNNEKFRTTDTGIDVTGEVAASQDYPDFEPVLNFNFTGSSTQIDPRLLYRRSGVASFVDANGLVKIVGENTPRFDHDPISRKNKGILIEHSRTNLLYRSIAFEDNGGYNANYSNARSTLTSTTEVAPDGTNTARKYVRTSGQGAGEVAIIINPLGLSSGTVYTTSVFVKLTSGANSNIVELVNIRADSSNSGSSFNLSTGVIVTDGSQNTTTITKFPNGWFRLTVTATANSGGYFWVRSGTGGQNQNEGDGFILWGGQVESGSYPSSFIPTYGRQTQRGADLLLVDGDDSTALSDAYNDQEGTLVVEYFNATNTDGAYACTIDDGSGNNRFGISNSNSSQGIAVSGGSSQGQLDNGTPIVGATNKMAHAYKLNDRGLSLNGNDATQDNGFALPTGIRFLWIGCREGSYDFLGSTISRFMYYTKRLPNSQLKLLTSQ